MKLNQTIDGEQSVLQNFKWYINRMIKHAKESLTEEEQNSMGLTKILEREMKCGFGDVIEYTFFEELVYKELFDQIVNNEWQPGDDEELKEYLHTRKSLVLPILEEGSLEYKLLNEAYDRILNEETLDPIVYLVMTMCGVFRWKTIDYHTLDTHKSS